MENNQENQNLLADLKTTTYDLMSSGSHPLVIIDIVLDTIFNYYKNTSNAHQVNAQSASISEG